MNRKTKYYIVSLFMLLGGITFASYTISYDPELSLILDLIGKIFFPGATGGEWGLIAIPIIWGVAIGLLITGFVFLIKAVKTKTEVRLVEAETQSSTTAQPITRVRWKSGITAFIFLVTLGFTTLNPFGAGSDFSGSFGIAFITLGAVLLTTIFLFTIYRSEKKIVENRYSFWWLAGLNAIFIILLYAIGYLGLLGFINFYFGFGGPGEAAGYAAAIAIAMGVIWIPIAVLSVSAIPSLFCYKFHENKRVSRATLLLFAALSLALASYSVTNSSTCNFNRNYLCIADKAIETHDDSLCEMVKDVHKNFSERTYCYLELSRSGAWRNIELCDKLTDREKTRCLVNIGIRTNDPSICGKISTNSSANEKEFCYNAVKYKTVQ